MTGASDSSPDQAIQGIVPGQVIETSDAAAYRDAIAAALRADRPVVDYGIEHRGLGQAPPEGYAFIVAPGGVLDHYVADMTVRVGGGTTLADLRAELAHRNQWLPIDGATGRATVAELIAHNAYGPLRLTHGSTRDLLLGLAFVDGAGELITVGGRTVKNVAGYDLTRLMVGSLNTFGLITEATLRTAAIPKQITTVTFALPHPVDLDSCITNLLTSEAAPTFLDLQTHLNGQARHRLHVGYADTPAACDVLHDALLNWLDRVGLTHEPPTRYDASADEDNELRDERREWRGRHDGVVKLIVRPGVTGRLVEELAALDPAPAVLDALPAHGVVHLGANWSKEQAHSADRALRDVLQTHGGMRVWLNRPDHDPTLAPFAPEQPDWPVLGELKQTFDPKNLLNPGRFPYPVPAEPHATPVNAR
ncbi:MAG: FAD-binding oxidoreductase [Planctomycetota bacterium]|jgi:glycolate oxidase FAD binding subunit